MFAYALYKLGAFLALWLPLPIARRGAAAVGRLTSIFQRRNRKALYRNLETAFGDSMTPRELGRLRSEIYGNFATFVLEFLLLPKVDRSTVRDLLTPQSLETYERVKRLAAERGPVVFLSAHLGNWELGAAAGSLLGLPLTVLVDAHPSPLVTRFFNERRENKGLRVVSVTEFQKCFRAMHRKEFVAIAGDRPVTGQGIRMPYFGRPALVPDGHAVLARKFGGVILPGVLVKRDDGRYEYKIEPPIVPQVTDDFDADVRDCVEKCLRVFERFIRANPEQWYVFHPIWDDTTADRLRLRGERIKARQSKIDARIERIEARRNRMQEHRKRLEADRKRLERTEKDLRAEDEAGGRDRE